MASDDYWDDAWFGADDYADRPDLNDVLFGNNLEVDQRAQDLFADAFFNDDDRAYLDLVQYLHDEYNIDFEAEFEWEDFREWYDGAG